jgi:acyl carrier protein
MNEIRERLIVLLCKQLNHDNSNNDFPLNASLIDLGLDSIDAINLVLEIENVFGIEFPEEMLSQATFKSADTLETAIRSIISVA